MRNIKLTIEYDGTGFHGWQKQPGMLNIQGTIEQAIESIVGHSVSLIGSGRTDAGVHALGQVANFKTDSKIPIGKMAIAINSRLPETIIIKKAEEVPEDFNSRLSCKKKTYRYIVNNSEQGTAIYRNLEYHISNKLNIEKMQEAAKYLEGEHDFNAFKASKSECKSSIRTIYNAVVKKENDRIIIELTGSGFLYNMVRIIAGTLVEVGIEKLIPNDLPKIIESKQREMAGKTLPAQGLYLVKVEYK